MAEDEEGLGAKVEEIVRSSLGKLLGDGTLKVDEGEGPAEGGPAAGPEGDELKSPREAESDMAAKVKEAVAGITINVNGGSDKKEEPKPIEAGPPGRPPLLRRIIGLAD